MSLLLPGCHILDESFGDQGHIRVLVECEQGADVDLQLDLDRQQQQRETKTEGIPALPKP